MTDLMANVCIEQKNIDKHTREGFRILARIIARDFLANQASKGDCKGDNDTRLYETA